APLAYRRSPPRRSSDLRGSGQLAHTKSQAAVSQYRLLYLELAGRQFDAPLKAAIGNFHTPYAHARRSGHGPLSHDGQECSVDNDLYSVGSHSRQSDEHHNVRLCFKDIGGWRPGGPAVTRLTESEKLAVQTVGLCQHIDSLGPHGAGRPTMCHESGPYAYIVTLYKC